MRQTLDRAESNKKLIFLDETNQIFLLLNGNDVRESGVDDFFNSSFCKTVQISTKNKWMNSYCLIKRQHMSTWSASCSSEPKKIMKRTKTENNE